ncbi:MAG: DUF1499 domain-containing protein [Desulfuromonadales bacterium]|nr:DUF1499 domain-containing protein [Desulfuromonadales bacterium]
MKTELMKVCLLALVVLMTTTVQADTLLPPCPGSPNCVSSQAIDGHRIEPFRITGDSRSAFERLRRILSQRSDTRITAAGETTIRVEFRTTLEFVDDGLFMLDAANNLIQVRSAARLGYWNLGKNRRRMELIRKSFVAK